MPLTEPPPIPKDGQSSTKRALHEDAKPASFDGWQCKTAPAAANLSSCNSSGDPVLHSVSKHSPSENPRDLMLAVPSKSQRHNSSCEALQPLNHPNPSCTPAQASFQDHEALAADLLQRKDFSAASAIRLVDMLPRESGLRKVQGHGGSRLCMGAYFRAGVVSLYKNNTVLKHSCKYLCAFIHHVAPRHVFAALDILDEVQSGLHLDRFNFKRSSSLVVPITSFSGGGLWVEDPAGIQPMQDGAVERLGYVHDFTHGPCLFDPHSRHAVMPWDGRRVVIAAYLPMGVDSADSSIRSQLSGLGFVLRVFPSPEPPPALLDPREQLEQTDSSPHLDVKVPEMQAGSDELFSSFAHLLPSDLLVVELCAGTAILSKTAAARGFRTMPVDNNSRRAPGKNVLRIDLADPKAVAQLLEIIQSERDRVAMVFIAPPCGTASLARERKLLRWARKGFRIPVPLRNAQFPDMLPGLSSMDKKKVELASQLYAQVTRISVTCISLGILVVIENPATSLCWLTSFFVELKAFCSGHNVDFHSCCHGGQRPKHTRFWVSQQVFHQLSMFCDGSHWHKPWTPRRVGSRLHFTTADEAAYPLLLCQRLMDALLELCFPQLPSTSLPDISLDRKATRVALGVQPRGHAFGPLVPDFAGHCHFICPANQPKAVEARLSDMPKGSKIVRRRLGFWGDFGPALTMGEISFGAMPDLCTCDPAVKAQWQEAQLELFTIGVPYCPEGFIDKAFEVGHPRGFDFLLEPAIHEAIKANFVQAPYHLAKLRIEFVKKWTDRARDLQAEENRLHAAMPPYLAKVLSGKRLLLMAEMMRAAKCPDESLIQDIQSGFRISGWMPRSGNTQPQVKRPAMSVDTLLVLSRSLNRSTYDRLKNRQDADLEEAAWAETQKEIDAGWSWIANDGQRTDLFIALRFALRQGPTKVRLIDDCTINGLNGTIGLRERFELHTVDKLAAMLVTALGQASAEGLKGWVGRTFDLKSAYKQYGIHPFDREHLRLAVNKPGEASPNLLGVNSLPFGATGSVCAFLRVASALWRIGVVLLKLVWSSFFDDFTNVTRDVLANNTRWAIETLFDLLGINFDRDGKKAPPYAAVFNMLGLQVDLTESCERRISVGHTDSRRSELLEFLQGILDQGSLEPRVFERLRGRMVFFEGFSFGRVPNRAVRALSAACRNAPTAVRLHRELEFCIGTLMDRVKCASPLVIQPCSRETWILFTDGACEPEKCWGGVGAVLFGPNRRVAGFFGESVDPQIMQRLFASSANPIYELEIAPILISLHLWGSMLAGAQLVCYLDNEGAKHSCIRCFAHSEPADSWVASIAAKELELQLKTWFGRVGTASNIADGPSRLDFGNRLLEECVRTRPCLSSLL